MTTYTFYVEYKKVGYNREPRCRSHWKIEAKDHYEAFKKCAAVAEMRDVTLCEISLKYKSNKLRHAM